MPRFKDRLQSGGSKPHVPQRRCIRYHQQYPSLAGAECARGRSHFQAHMLDAVFLHPFKPALLLVA